MPYITCYLQQQLQFLCPWTNSPHHRSNHSTCACMRQTVCNSVYRHLHELRAAVWSSQHSRAGSGLLMRTEMAGVQQHVGMKYMRTTSYGVACIATRHLPQGVGTCCYSKAGFHVLWPAQQTLGRLLPDRHFHTSVCTSRSRPHRTAHVTAAASKSSTGKSKTLYRCSNCGNGEQQTSSTVIPFCL